MPHTPPDLQAILRDMMAPDRCHRPSAEELLKKRQLLSEEQRQLIVERNKVTAANMALDAHMVRGNKPTFYLCAPQACLSESLSSLTYYSSFMLNASSPSNDSSCCHQNLRMVGNFIGAILFVKRKRIFFIYSTSLLQQYAFEGITTTEAYLVW